MICLVFDWFEGGLAGLWVVCRWFGWFVGSLDGLSVVWLVCSWSRVLQPTAIFRPRAYQELCETSKAFCENFECY